MNPRDESAKSVCCKADVKMSVLNGKTMWTCRNCDEFCELTGKRTISQVARAKSGAWAEHVKSPNVAPRAENRPETRADAENGEIQATAMRHAPKMSGAERKYRLLLLTEFPDVRFEAITFKMRNGHRYTPDFMCANADGDVLEFHEVKGSYRLRSHSRARLAFDQCREEYGMFKFVWAVQNKGGGFDVELETKQGNSPEGRKV